MQKRFPVFVNLHGGKFMVVQSGTAHFRVIERESQWFDQMQLCTGIGAQTNDVSGVRRDFRFDQYDMKHFSSPVTV